MANTKRIKGQALAEYAAVALALTVLLAGVVQVVRIGFPPLMTGTAKSLSSEPLSQ